MILRGWLWPLLLLAVGFVALLLGLRYAFSHGHPDLRFQDVITSPNDLRQAAYVVLPNGLPVLLVSDPHGDRAGAAVDVAVGSLDDPEDRQGLAHFVEHMLFLGSEKYPDEADFKDYLQLRGGSSNAFTDQWHTNFFFSVQGDSLEGGLDRLAQFFIAPLLSASPASREIAAVNNEFEKNLQDDGWTMWQLCKHLADPRHPFHKFSTGNKATLHGNGTVTELRRFYAQHYTTAAKMRLVVVGQESVPQLARWAAASFAAIPNRPATASTPLSTPLPPVWPQTGLRVYVQPVADLRKLHFVWELPPLLPHYRAMVPRFLSAALEGADPGGLYMTLKAQGWAEAVDLDLRFVRDFALLDIVVSLTAEGLDRYPAVAAAVFGYLRLLRRRGLHCSLWGNAWRLEDLAFRFREAPGLDDFVSGAATDMQFKAPADVLGSPAHYRCDRRRLRDVLARLTPQNVLLFVVARTPRTLPETEPLFGTRYALERIPFDAVERWVTAAPMEGMQLPAPNRFLPTAFSLHYTPSPRHRMRLLEDRPGLRVWQQPSQRFATPKAVFSCVVRYPHLRADREALGLLRLYTGMLEDRLEGPLYPATQVQTDWSLVVDDASVILSISGFTAVIRRLLRVLLEVIDQPLQRDRFAVVRARLIDALVNRQFDNGFTYAWRVLRPEVMESPAFPLGEQLRVLRGATLRQLRAFVDGLRHEAAHLECLGLGNLEARQVRTMAQRVAFVVQSTPCPRVAFRNVILLPPGRDTAVLLRAPNPADPNSVLLSTFQRPTDGSLRDALALELAQFITDPEAFNVLRTEEQLGYVVFTAVFSTHTPRYNVSTYHFLIQSGDFGPDYLDERVEAFLHYAEGLLQRISDDDLLRMKRGLMEQKWPRPLALKDEFAPRWREVLGRTYQFDRQADEEAVLPTITREEVAAAFQQVLVDRRQRRKLSILVYGKGHELVPGTGAAQPAETVELPQLARWKTSLAVLPG